MAFWPAAARQDFLLSIVSGRSQPETMEKTLPFLLPQANQGTCFGLACGGIAATSQAKARIFY
jgi:hypothetical protein